MDDLDLAMDPMSTDRLGYASADPVNNTDEDGHRIDYCQGMCISSTTGKAYQSYGYAGYGGSKVQVHTQTYGNTCYGVCAVRLAQQRAAAAMAATRARWLAAKAQRERKLEKIRAQRAARAAALNQKCKKNPFQPDCGRWRGQHQRFMNTVVRPPSSAPPAGTRPISGAPGGCTQQTYNNSGVPQPGTLVNNMKVVSIATCHPPAQISDHRICFGESNCGAHGYPQAEHSADFAPGGPYHYHVIFRWTNGSSPVIINDDDEGIFWVDGD